MDKPTPLYQTGMTVCIPDVPVMELVKGRHNSKWHYGRCSHHPVGSKVEITNVTWATHVEQWTYSIEMNQYLWRYLESDLLIGSGVHRIDGQLSLFSV